MRVALVFLIDLEKLRCIDIDGAVVKGLTWDPAGQYLAVQVFIPLTKSDDKSVRILRTSDWEEQIEITSNFTQAASTTFFRRLSWSPDGGSIVTANGESGSLCIAPIIYRQDWECKNSLVGHQAPVEVAVSSN